MTKNPKVQRVFRVVECKGFGKVAYIKSIRLV